MLATLAFYLFALVMVLSATAVITARNPVHSVLFLILAFFNAAGLFVMLGAEFLAMILVIVYVGAVAVLFLFVVMMLDVDAAEVRASVRQYLPVGALVGMLLFFTSSSPPARWTPLANWFVVAGLVVVGAPSTGTSLSPARSLGPAWLDPLLSPFWIYVVGPTLGALAAVSVFALFRQRAVLTAKLFHDPAYPSTLGTALPAR